MTNEERDLIIRFIERVGGAASAPGGQGAVAPLPPVDREADALIAELFARYPEARYRVTQMAFVQEHALAEAQNRIARLQWELQNARAQAAPQQASSPWGAAAQPQPQQSRGFFSGLFGGGSSAPPQPPQYAAPPPPQYPPNYNPGMFQQQGPGFLGSALQTAAGVAGGMLAANALMGLFSGGHGGYGGYGGGFGGGGFAGGYGSPVVNETINETTIINEAPPSSPWATPDTGSGWQQASSDTGSNAIDWDDSASSGGDGGGWGNDDSA
jgi:hypothetical protein